MDIFELASTLPNGLHDAQLSRLTVDYVGRTAEFELEIWIGDLSSQSEAERERLRSAVLHLDGLVYCVIDPPDRRYPYSEGRSISIDVHPIDATKAPALPANLPPTAFAFRMWAGEWNAFLYAAATEARLTWRDLGS